MPRRLPVSAALLVACVALVPARTVPAAPPTTHADVPSALKESKTLRVPAFVVLTKPKAAPPAAFADPRVVRSSRVFACASAPLTAALAKQYELTGDAHALVLAPDGTVLAKFDADATPEKMIADLKARAADARDELLKNLSPESDAKAKKAALPGLARLGPPAERLIPLLADPSAEVKAAAKKALVELPLESSIPQLLDALKSDEAAVRVAVHPLAVQATGYKGAPLKVWQSGTVEERAAAWDKWNDVVQTQFPPLNRAVLAYCEFNVGVQVANGECAMLAVEALKEGNGKPFVPNGPTYIWGRALKPGEPVLPGDIVQYEGAKFTNVVAPHHTSVIRKVLAPNRYEILEQNVGGVKKVQAGKLDLTALKEGSVVIYRPLPK